MTFWLILALIITFLHLPNKDPINSMYYLGLLVVGTGIIGTKIFKVNKALGTGVFCVLASYMVILGTPLVSSSFRIIVFFLLWTVVYWAALTAKKRTLFWAFGIVGTISAIYLIIQRLGYDPVFNHLNMSPRYPIYGLLGSIGNTACFQALCLPIAASISPILGVCTFIGLALTGNATGTAAGMVGLGYYLWLKGSWKILVMILIIASVGIVFLDKPTKADFQQRWLNIIYSLKYIKKGEIRCVRKPIAYKRKYTLFGYGLGSFKNSMPFIPTKEVDGAFNRGKFDYLAHPHNEPTFILYDLGPIALIVAGWIMLHALKTPDIAIKGSILAFIVCAIGYFPLTVIPVMTQLAILLGLADKEKR